MIVVDGARSPTVFEASSGSIITSTSLFPFEAIPTSEHASDFALRPSPIGLLPEVHEFGIMNLGVWALHGMDGITWSFGILEFGHAGKED